MLPMQTDTEPTPTPMPPAVRRSRARRAARALAWTVAGLVMIVMLLAAGAWWYIGSDKSLAFALAQAAQRLPAGQTLESRDVTGFAAHRRPHRLAQVPEREHRRRGE